MHNTAITQMLGQTSLDGAVLDGSARDGTDCAPCGARAAGVSSSLPCRRSAGKGACLPTHSTYCDCATSRWNRDGDAPDGAHGSLEASWRRCPMPTRHCDACCIAQWRRYVVMWLPVCDIAVESWWRRARWSARQLSCIVTVTPDDDAASWCLLSLPNSDATLWWGRARWSCVMIMMAMRPKDAASSRWWRHAQCSARWRHNILQDTCNQQEECFALLLVHLLWS